MMEPHFGVGMSNNKKKGENLMNNKIAPLSLATALLALTGCATVTRGTSEVLVIESEPPGAVVEVTPANQQCKPPCTMKLRRKDNQSVSIHKDGYEPVQVDVLSQVAGAGAAGMAGNVLVGGLIGAAIDAGSGATKELKPNPVKVNLVATAPAPVVSATPAVSPPELAAPPASSPPSVVPAATAPEPSAEATLVHTPET